jgi:hypothetical protein
MGWTSARLIAVKGIWFPELLDNDGPACYELGTGGPRGGNIQWHYVGETTNERSRIECYARNGSHLSKLINWHLNQGWCLYYRASACVSKSPRGKCRITFSTVSATNGTKCSIAIDCHTYCECVGKTVSVLNGKRRL